MKTHSTISVFYYKIIYYTIYNLEQDMIDGVGWFYLQKIRMYSITQTVIFKTCET